jgi:DNA modification methylase
VNGKPARRPAVAKAPPRIEWPADAVERRPIADLIPYARNARTHSDAQVAQIAASIREWGWTIPLLVDEAGELIAGHGRVLAARQLNIETVPVMTARGWSEAKIRAYRIADNKLGLNSGWDNELLGLELADLRDLGADLSGMGFNLDELRAYTGGLGGEDDPADAIPEEAAETITRPGDIWCLGRHRLICGDATDSAVVARLMRDEMAGLCFTSPPYGQQRDYGSPIAEWTALMSGFSGVLPLTDAGQLLVNLGLIHRDGEWDPYWDEWFVALRKLGWRRFAWYVWDQGPGFPGEFGGRLRPSFEFIFHFNHETISARKTKPVRQVATRAPSSILRDRNNKKHVTNSPLTFLNQQFVKPDSVFRVSRRTGALHDPSLDHPAVFPVALAEEVITAFTNEGDVVFEPFAGSGSQIIAAERTKRTCYACELHPAYVDVAVARWLKFVGQPATLDGDGRTFVEVAAERGQKDAA